MSVFNGERYLAQAVNSILTQTLADFEFVIVDDGSTDRTADILTGYARSDARIRVFRNENNLGLARSLNRGLKEVRTPFVARMDADDISVPRRLERQLSFLLQNPNVDVVGAQLRLLGTSTIWKPPEKHDDIVARMCFRSPICHPTVMLRRERTLKKAGEEPFAYDERRLHAEDYDLWVRLGIDHGVRFANIPAPLVDYRRHDEAASERFADVQKQTSSTIRRYLLTKLEIVPSEAEMALHDDISDVRVGDDVDVLQRCAAWMRRLEQANAIAGVFPSKAFARVLGEWWFAVCKKNFKTSGGRAASFYLRETIGYRPTFARWRAILAMARSAVLIGKDN